MTKILLVEDDKSLREIYGVRLLAEGYDIVSASDGEEALAMAIKERPDLILSDVMMPKISGFDMLDILRSTTETKDIRVIIMTALSSDEQRSRGETLGADLFLVKSQVGIEDVVTAIKETLMKPREQAPDAMPPQASVTNPEASAQEAPQVASPAPSVETPAPAPANEAPRPIDDDLPINLPGREEDNTNVAKAMAEALAVSREDSPAPSVEAPAPNLNDAPVADQQNPADTPQWPNQNA